MSETSGSRRSAPPTGVIEDQRAAVIDQIREALLRDQLTFREVDDRFAEAYAATTPEALSAVVADLDVSSAPTRQCHPLPLSAVSIVGDLKKGGEVAVEGALSYTAVFGDVVLDLSSAELDDGSSITVSSVVGDTTVILPDGVRANLRSVSVFGEQQENLSPPLPGAPTVFIRTRNLFGDAKLYSLSRVPEGRLRRMWRALRLGRSRSESSDSRDEAN